MAEGQGAAGGAGEKKLNSTDRHPTTVVAPCAGGQLDSADVCQQPGAQATRVAVLWCVLHLKITGLDGTPQGERFPRRADTQGEQIQWHDLYVSLLLGCRPRSRRLTSDYLDAFDIIISDYIGVLNAMDSSVRAKHACKLRLLDSWGTDAGPNMQDGHGFCCLKLPSLSQFGPLHRRTLPTTRFWGTLSGHSGR